MGWQAPVWLNSDSWGTRQSKEKNMTVSDAIKLKCTSKPSSSTRLPSVISWNSLKHLMTYIILVYFASNTILLVFELFEQNQVVLPMTIFVLFTRVSTSLTSVLYSFIPNIIRSIIYNFFTLELHSEVDKYCCQQSSIRYNWWWG